jgi:hypothetical protein
MIHSLGGGAGYITMYFPEKWSFFLEMDGIEQPKDHTIFLQEKKCMVTIDYICGNLLN